MISCNSDGINDSGLVNQSSLQHFHYLKIFLKKKIRKKEFPELLNAHTLLLSEPILTDAKCLAMALA